MKTQLHAFVPKNSKRAISFVRRIRVVIFVTIVPNVIKNTFTKPKWAFHPKNPKGIGLLG